MPEGAQSEDVENIARIRAYLVENIENWYRFANGPRGRDARNGDLRLVIGTDKATSWGIAAFSNATGHVAQPTECQFHFKPTGNEEPSVCKYTWEYSGVAEVQVGPAVEEGLLLREGDNEPPLSGKYTNQCLFIRTMNTKLSKERWTVLCQEMGTQHLDDIGFNNDQKDYLSSRPSEFGNPSSQPSASGSGVDSTSRQHAGQESAPVDDSVTVIVSDSFGGDMAIHNPPTSIVSTMPESIMDCSFPSDRYPRRPIIPPIT